MKESLKFQQKKVKHLKSLLDDRVHNRSTEVDSDIYAQRSLHYHEGKPGKYCRQVPKWSVYKLSIINLTLMQLHTYTSYLFIRILLTYTQIYSYLLQILSQSSFGSSSCSQPD